MNGTVTNPKQGRRLAKYLAGETYVVRIPLYKVV
jgi:hypothetical protein